MSVNEPGPGPRRGLVGRTLADRYRIDRVVSAGNNTVIVDAEDLERSSAVTIKLVRPEWSESAEFRRRFARVMKAMSTLSHPNVAAVHDWGEDEIGQRTTSFAVVERLTGGSLRDLFDRNRLLDPSQALMIGLEACRGLDFAHSRGLVHTELTPSKLVFGDDRRLRIVDFGLARLLGRQDWREPATVATHVARYASPEQALAQPVDGKSDVYALALILVEAVTGSVPFAAGSTVATLSARVGRLMPVSADLGPLAAVLERAGRPEPEERSTAAELGRGLVGVASKLPRPAPIPIVAATVFERDPAELRRPNDPTGGVTRPDDTPAVPLVPPVIDETTDVEIDEPSPEVEAEALAATVATVATEMTTLPAPVDEPAAVVEEEPPSTSLYDGDADATVDELAALAAPPPDPEPLPPPAPSPEGSPRRRRWLPWSLALLLVVVIGGLGLLAYRLFRTPTHEVPELAGLTEADATRLTDGFDWELDVERARSDQQPEPGAIIRTAPEAGEDLAEGEPFLIVVSEGPELRGLPDLQGLALAEAETALAELRLVALPATEQFDEDVPTGDVVSWSVPAASALAAGDEVPPDTEIALVVSAGPAPRTIPELAGVALVEATARLEADELVVTVGEQVFSDTVAIGGVVSADPAPGASVPRGSTVLLVASKGIDVVTMPDVSGQTLPQAQATLAGAGLTLGSLLGSTQGVVESASVGGEEATAGAQFKRGSAVDLVLL